MIFREDGEVGAFCSGRSYEVGGSGEVVGRVDRLWGEYQLMGVGIIVHQCDKRWTTLGWSWMMATLYFCGAMMVP